MIDSLILIVEDNKSNLKLLSTFLSKRGYNIISSITAEDALITIQEKNPVIILMDLQLPGMDGLQLTKILKSNSQTKDIHIIALTAFASGHDKNKALKEGCDDYMSKPVDMLELSNKLDSYLFKKRQ